LWNLGTDRRRRLALFAHVAVLIVLLDGLPGLAEPNPRFNTAWLHAGFIQHVATGQGLLLHLDARFSWAGFFSGAALVQRAAGTATTLWMVRFTPVFFAAFACWVIWIIGRTLRFTVIQRQVAMVIFVVGNWSGQDYFSPQATSFCLFYTLCAVALVAFAGPGLRPGRRLDRWLRPARWPQLNPLDQAERAAAYLGFVVVICAVVLTHQLTPGFISLAFLLLAITGSTRLRSFPFISGFLTLAWTCYAAEAYWTGHFDKLVGGVGSLGNLVQANIGKRASGGTMERSIVVASRIGMAGLIWAAAGLAAIILWRRRSTPVAAMCLFGAGFPLLILQPYGGEMLIRVFLFSLPAVSLLIATLVVPSYRTTPGMSKVVGILSRRSPKRLVAAGVIMAATVPLFLLARFGNESYERVSTNDRRTVNVLYRSAPVDSVVYIEDRQALLSSQRVGEVRFQNLSSVDPHQVEAQIRSSTGRQAATYILLTESEQAYAEQVFGLPTHWADGLARSLLDNGGYVLEFRAGRSMLLRATVPIPEPPVPKAIRAR
ncbi:MAG: hypothetical protein M3N98_08990, partial [Actinomycetota bacterium]|nr:hypothetical protein [Actinomycetota bacterium]